MASMRGKVLALLRGYNGDKDEGQDLISGVVTLPMPSCTVYIS